MTQYTTSEPTQEIPYGYCHCGCGGTTKIATAAHRGYMKGEPMRYIHGHHGYKDFLPRFWSRVKIDDALSCWEWTGAKTTAGYGHIIYRGKSRFAHRASYELHVGPIPDGLLVCHRCDNPSCVNPAHLFLGTNKDNVTDSVTKGRKPQGETHVSAKLTECQVLEIRTRHAAGNITCKALALEFGVKRGTVEDIVHRKNWKHLP